MKAVLLGPFAAGPFLAAVTQEPAIEHEAD